MQWYYGVIKSSTPLIRVLTVITRQSGTRLRFTNRTRASRGTFVSTRNHRGQFRQSGKHKLVVSGPELLLSKLIIYASLLFSSQKAKKYSRSRFIIGRSFIVSGKKIRRPRSPEPLIQLTLRRLRGVVARWHIHCIICAYKT